MPGTPNTSRTTHAAKAAFECAPCGIFRTALTVWPGTETAFDDNGQFQTALRRRPPKERENDELDLGLLF
jgi:hypothetical protein